MVANGASGVVFVVGADQTSRQAARAAFEQLQSAHAHVIGAVLNRVDLERNPYYYAHYYRKEYAKYLRESAHSHLARRCAVLRSLRAILSSLLVP